MTCTNITKNLPMLGCCGPGVSAPDGAYIIASHFLGGREGFDAIFDINNSRPTRYRHLVDRMQRNGEPDNYRLVTQSWPLHGSQDGALLGEIETEYGPGWNPEASFLFIEYLSSSNTELVSNYNHGFYTRTTTLSMPATYEDDLSRVLIAFNNSGLRDQLPPPTTSDDLIQRGLRPARGFEWDGAGYLDLGGGARGSTAGATIRQETVFSPELPSIIGRRMRARWDITARRTDTDHPTPTCKYTYVQTGIDSLFEQSLVECLADYALTPGGYEGPVRSGRIEDYYPSGRTRTVLFPDDDAPPNNSNPACCSNPAP